MLTMSKVKMFKSTLRKNSSNKGNVNNVKMLIMLIHFGTLFWNAQWDLTSLTLLSFPLWEAKSASDRGDVNNVNTVKSLF